MSKQLQRALSCLSWTRGSHQSPDEPSSAPTGHLPARAQPQAFLRGGGKLYHQTNSRVIIFPVLQVCFRMPRGAEWIWLSLNQTIAAFRRKSLRKLPWKLAVCCALTPASLHGPPLCPEGIQTWICTHSMRGEIGNQSSLAQTKMNDIVYFHQPEICVPPTINDISTKGRKKHLCVSRKRKCGLWNKKIPGLEQCGLVEGFPAHGRGLGWGDL